MQCFPTSESTALFEGSQASPFVLPIKKSTEIKTRMEHLWNDNERVNLKCTEKNLLQYHNAHYKSQKDWPGIETGPPQ